MSVHYTVTNKSASQVCTELYLDAKTSDVNFVVEFEGELPVSIPAHKNILSVVSPVFDAMFYGPMKEIGDVKIVDAPNKAFQEFLKFFYLQKVQLTSDNIMHVTKLCHKYDVDDALKLCEKPLQKSVQINNMCTVYALADLFKMEQAIKFCREKIKQNADDVLKSADFMECNQNILFEILQILCSTSKCSLSVIIDRCIAWAKTKCAQKNVDVSSINMKNEFGVSVLNFITSESLRIPVTCARYATVIQLFKEKLLSSADLIGYEMKIKHSPDAILKSADFLSCDRKMLDKILELVSSKCDPQTIVESSMAWAKAECERNGLENTPANLRGQLNDSFDRIPFADLNKEQFSQHINGYKRFFTEDDLEMMMMQTMSKRTKTTEPPKKITFFLADNRRLCNYLLSSCQCSFKLNARLHLKELRFIKLRGVNGANHNVNALITLRGPTSEKPYQLGNITLSSDGEANLVVPISVVIDPNETYVLSITAFVHIHFYIKLFPIVCSKQDDVEIQFSPDSRLISGLVFERPSA